MCSLHQPCGVCLVLKTGGPRLFFENACCKKWKDYPAFACSPHNSSTGCSICALSVASPRSSGTVSPLPAPGAGTRLRGPKKLNERRRYKGCFLPRPPSVASAPYAEVTGRATSHQFFPLCRSSSVWASHRRQRLPRARPLPCAQFSSGWTFYRKLGPPRRRQCLFVPLDFFFSFLSASTSSPAPAESGEMRCSRFFCFLFVFYIRLVGLLRRPCRTTPAPRCHQVT